jgi:hypothetical protein
MLTAHHLRFTLKIETPLELDEHQGAALRGMLFNALRGPTRNPALGFCTQRHLTTCADCALVAVCPVASLVATLNPQAERGRDVPRPYAIVPPLTGQTRYRPGETFTFGLTLFGQALSLFPYVVMALNQAGPGGLGKKLPQPERPDRYQRGRFSLHSAQAVNLLTGEIQEVLQANNPQVQQPVLPVTEAQVMEYSQHLLSHPIKSSLNGQNSGLVGQAGLTDGLVQLTLHFKTPTRIIADKKLLKTPQLSPIFHRLLDRLAALSREFGLSSVESSYPGAPTSRPHDPGLGVTPQVSPNKNELLALSDQVALVADQTQWQEVASYSARQQKKTFISGFIGQATYQAPRAVWTPILPYLVWGTVIHVGKNAVKGDGMVSIERASLTMN